MAELVSENLEHILQNFVLTLAHAVVNDDLTLHDYPMRMVKTYSHHTHAVLVPSIFIRDHLTWW